MKRKINMWKLQVDKDHYAYGFIDDCLVIIDKSDPSSHIKLPTAMCKWIGKKGYDKLSAHIKLPKEA